MTTAQAGSAYIPVRPDLTGFHRAILAELRGLEPEVLRLGNDLGAQLSRGIRTGLGDPLRGPLEESSRRRRSSAPGQGDEVAGAFARGFQARLRAAFASLPKAQIDADSSPAERRIAELRARMEELSKKTIGVDIDAGQATAQIAAIKAELRDIGRNASIDVRADTAAASAELTRVEEQVRRLDGKTARVNVEASGGAGLLGLGIVAGGAAALPIASALAGGAGVLGGGLLSAGAGFGGLAAVAVPALTKIKAAMQAQTQAQQNAAQTASQNQSRQLALAGAEQTLAAAVRNEAYVHQQALQQVQGAEQQLGQAQVSEGDAQRALTQARIDAKQHIEDLKNSLLDSGLAIQQDQINVEKAKFALDQLNASTSNAVALQQAQAQLSAAMQAQKAVDGDPLASKTAKDVAAAQVAAAQAALKNAQTQKTATDLQRKEAELAYKQAIQQLKEQQLQYQRLQAEQKKAAKAGVDGSEQVIQARERLHQADLQVASAEQALANARANVARQDRQAADQVAAARRGVTSATLQGQAANAKLTRSLAALTPAEKALMGEWKAFTSTYKEWAKALEPAVLPVLADGIGLVRSQLGRFNPLIVSSASAFRVLEADAKSALAGPFWASFIADVSVAAPQAIIGFGHIAGHTFEGVAGVIRAFLPFTQELLTAIDRAATRFDQWGQSLGSSSGFASFISAVRRDGALVAHDLVAVGGALLEIGKAAYPLGGLLLQVIGPLAQGIGALARTNPQLVQLAAGLYAVVKVNQALQVTSLITGFRGLAAAEGAAAAGAAGAGVKLRALGAIMVGVEAEAVTTRQALLGLGLAAGVAGAILVLPPLLQKINDSESGAVQSTNDLGAALTRLGQTGQWGGALAQQFKVNSMVADLDHGRKSVDEFTRAVREIANPNFADYINHAGQAVFGWIPGVTTDLETAHNKLSAVDQALTQMVQSGQTTQAAAAFGQLSDKLKAAGFNTDQINKILPNYTSLVGGATFKNQLFTQSVQEQNLAMSASAHAFADQQGEIISFQQQIAYATGLVTTNGKAFWGNTTAALANRQSIIQAAGTVQNYSDNLSHNNQLTDASIKKLKDQRDALIVQAEKFGLSRDAAAKYVDKLLKIPKAVKTGITVNATGQFKMAGGQNLNNLITNTPGLQFLPKNAAGGLIGGSGGARADDKVTRISSGEFVVNAPATSRYLPLLARINDEGNRGSGYRGRGYAGGGLVRPEGAPVVSLPGLAGGGLLGKGSYTTSYSKSGDAADVLTATSREAAREVAGMVAFSVGRTALLSQIAMIAAAMNASGSGSANAVVAAAKSKLGTLYSWGGGGINGPSFGIAQGSNINGFDCSSLMQYAYWQGAKKQIPRTTYGQIGIGRGIGSQGALAPGDLVFPEAGHVMMVATPGAQGSQGMIHAPHTGDHVRMAPFRGMIAARRVLENLPSTGGAGGGVTQSAGQAQNYARNTLGQFGWSGGQYNPLDNLWTRESHWRWNAKNPSSGAYGIPQSLPASKMASAGADYLTNGITQVRWGLGYIKDRYGSPAAAWAHSQQTGWYDDGGWLQPGLNLAMNATGKPEPVLTGQQWDALTSGGSGGSSKPPVEYHAHFDGASSAALQSTVRTAFHVMGVETSMRERVGRRS